MATATLSSRLGPDVVNRTLSAAPVLVPLMVLAFGVTSTTLLLLEMFWVPLVVVVGLLLSAALVRVVGLGQLVERRRDRLLDAAAVLLAVLFALLNTRYTHQNLMVSRDPGVYTVGGQWLAHHHSMLVPYQRAVFGSREVGFASAGLGGLPGGVLYTQGAHLLPGLLGVTSAVFGDAALFRLNVVLGGLGLLSVYGFARLVTGRGWALLAVTLLGASLPQLEFSRDTFTEPVSQLLVFAGLSLLWTARPGQPSRWGVAGLVLAGGCLARIDAFLVLPVLVVWAAAMAATARRGHQRLLTARDALALLMGAAVPATLGLLDLVRLSPGYYQDLQEQFGLIRLLLEVSGVVGVAGVLAAWLRPRTQRPPEQAARWQAPLGAFAGVAVVLAGLALAARPLLGVQYLSDALPRRRSYAEISVQWLTWYLGVTTTALGLVGAAVLARRCLRSHVWRLVPFLLVFLSTSGLYLYKPSISPDHIWAMRRYLPVVMPGVVVSAVVVLERASARLPRVFWLRTTAGVTAGLLLLVPVVRTTFPVLRAREGAPQLAEVHRVCRALPANAAVLVVGPLRLTYPQTVRSYCDVPVGSVNASPTGGLLATVAASAVASGRRLYLVCADGVQNAVGTSPQSPAPRPISSIRFVTLTRPLDAPPGGVDGHVRQMYVGQVGADGLVTWVLPSPMLP